MKLLTLLDHMTTAVVWNKSWTVPSAAYMQEQLYNVKFRGFGEVNNATLAV